MPSVRASCCPLPLATPSGECVNHQSSVTLLCLDYKWGLFGIIKQICHASGGNMMECFPSGGWFSLGLRPRENHPPSGKHSIMLPPLAWHICIMLYCIMLYCIMLYCIVLYCIVLYCIVLHYIVLYCIILYYVVLYCIKLYYTVLYYVVLYCIILYCIALYCIVLYYIVLYYII